MLKGLGTMASSIGTLGKSIGGIAKGAAMGRYGGTAAGMAWGSLTGGAYGAMSDNTSIIGGMAGGALLGAGAGRYGGAGVRSLSRAMSPATGRGPRWPLSQAMQRAGRGMLGQMKGDALLASNKAINGFNVLRNRMFRR